MHIIWFLLLSIYSPRHKAHGSIAYWIGIRCKTTIRLYCVCTVENESVIEANASAEHCAERIHGTCVYLMRSHSNTIPTGKIRSEKPAHKIKLTSIKNRFNSKFMKMSSDINKYHTKWRILKCKNLKSKVKNRFFLLIPFFDWHSFKTKVVKIFIYCDMNTSYQKIHSKRIESKWFQRKKSNGKTIFCIESLAQIVHLLKIDFTLSSLFNLALLSFHSHLN